MSEAWHPDIPERFRDQVVCGDARELAVELPDESIDLVFTDPPYSRDVLDLYWWLGREARRVLRPGGFCFAYCGLSHLAEIVGMLGMNLDYFWTLCEFQPGSNSAFNPRRIVNKWRPVLVFSKGREPKHSGWLVDGRQTNRDKRFHEWGQPEDFPIMCISALTEEGAMIWEPFCGGGTTPAVCKRLNRHFVAFEKDPETAVFGSDRLRNTMRPLLLPDPDEPAQQTDFAEALLP